MTAPAPPPESDARAARAMVHLDGVTKRFATVEALRGVSIEVAPGEIFGLVGPSGCGKTSLVRLVVGLSVPTEGSARVFGAEPHRFTPRERERIGYAPQDFFLDPALTVRENCSFVGGLYGLSWRRRRRRIVEVLQTVQLTDARDRMARSLSGGMRRRLLLACALMHEPDLLVVDEPTSGLDPLLRQEVWEHLRRLRDEGTSVLLTTQYLDEADSCDRVAVLDQGLVVANGTPPELRASARQADILVFEVAEPGRVNVAQAWGMPGVRTATIAGNEIRIAVDDGAEATAMLSRWLDEQGASATAIRTQVPTFDEVFIELVRSANASSDAS